MVTKQKSILKKELTIIFLSLIFLSTASAEEVVRIDSQYSQNEFDFREAFTRAGNLLNEENPLLVLKYYNFRGELIHSYSITAPILGSPDWVYTLPLTIPYLSETKSIEVQTLDGVTIMTNYVGFLAETCGSGVCEEHESFADCPQDCERSSRDDYCNDGNLEAESRDGICDVDCLALGTDTEPFLFDTLDCGIPLPSEEDCNSMPTCHPEIPAVFVCVFDRNFQPHWIKTQVCLEGEQCVDGFCVGSITKIENYICRSSSDCIVNGQQWNCNCYNECVRPSHAARSDLCCNSRLFT